MIRAAIGFFVLGLIALFFGMGNIAGLSIQAGEMLLSVFLILAVISVVASLLTGRAPRGLR